MDSEGSKETIPEKQSNEEGEKGEIIEENGQEKEVNVEKEGKHKRKHESDPKLATIASEEELCRPWAMETNENEASLPAPNPCKKRPIDHGSNVYEDSLHRNEEGGMSVEDFVKHVRSMKRKGMYEEYARVKHEPPMGTFTASRYVWCYVNLKINIINIMIQYVLTFLGSINFLHSFNKRVSKIPLSWGHGLSFARFMYNKCRRHFLLMAFTGAVSFERRLGRPD